MKKWQSASAIAALMLLVVVLGCCSTLTLRAQPQLTAAQIAALTLLDRTNLPRVGTYWRLIGPNPGHPYPPLPCPPKDMLDVPIYALWQGHFLIDDSLVDYAALRQQREIDSALRSLEAQYGLSASPEGEGTVGPMGLTSYTADDLWLEITGITNTTGNFTVHPPVAEVTDGVYDLFMTTNLSPNVPGLNLTNWLWLLRTEPGQTNLAVPGLPLDQAFFILGRTNDTDGDLLTDAWEQLVGGTDPNTADASAISFSLSVPYDCVNSITVTGTVSVTSGFPTLMAVLVNSTNFDTATWVPLNTVVPVDLGSSDGRKEIRVGLRGPLPGIPLAWQWARVILDRTAPVLLITNPVNPTVSRPVIQLKGYSPEPLANLVFVATNALGEVTHGQGLVVDQFYDPTIPDLTTNWFECLDIQLSLGTNFVTLSATDRAGNIGQTNLAYVFTTNGATPPVLAILWPQDGSRLSGTNFTLRGTVDDETAAVTAQITAPGGPITTATAVVERSGKFWVENLPLGDGTNSLTVTAINAAGMLSSTNLSVVKTGMALTINPVPDAQLHRLRVTVTGSVGDTNYAIWVNGVPAVVDGSGNWSASDVPVTKGCTASFTATAYPPDEVPPPEAAGQGTNPATPNSCSFTLDQDKPPQVYIQHYEVNYYSWATNYFIRKGGCPETEHLHMFWEQEAPAIWRYDARCIYWTADVFTDWTYLSSWPTDTWEPVLEGTNVTTGATTNTSTVGPPDVPMEQCEIVGQTNYYNQSDNAVEPAYYSRVAQTIVKYFTGGKDAPGSPNLHELQATLKSKTFQWWFGLGSTLDGTNIIDGATAGIFGELGPDGLTYAALPDGQRVVATPSKAGVPYQGGGLPTVTKYKLRIFMGEQDVTDTNTTVVVGQHISLTNRLVGPPGKTPPPMTNYQWTIPGDTVKQYIQIMSTETFTIKEDLGPSDRASNSVAYYWINGGTNMAVVSTATVSNKTLEAKAYFSINRPIGTLTATTTTNAPPVNVLTNSDGSIVLQYGTYDTPPVRKRVGIYFSFAVTAPTNPTNAAGSFGYIQRVDSVTSRWRMDDENSTPWRKLGTNVLDTDPGGTIVNSLTAVGNNETKTNFWADSPGFSLYYPDVFSCKWATRSDNFTGWLVYKPAGDAIWVTLREVHWSWSGGASKDTNGVWTLSSGYPPPPANPSSEDSIDLPTWNGATITLQKVPDN